MIKLLAFIIIQCSAIFAIAQKGNFSFYSGVGIMGGIGEIENSIHPSLALISGIDLKINQRVFIQGSAGFNALNYDQFKEDSNTELLIKNSKSNALMLGVNIGVEVFNNKNRFNIAPYLGTGYLRLQEPRFTQTSASIITQSSKFSNAFLGRVGLFTSYDTKIAILQTVFINSMLWGTSLSVQDYGFNGYSLTVGTKYKM